MSEIIERELGWDDEISRESDFTIIPEGDYDFTVTGFERGRHEGSEKLPPCNMAIVTLAVTLPDGSTANLRHRLFLHTRCEGLLSAFFTGIGLKRKGEPLRMNWNAVPGAHGRCKITVRSWKGKNGEDMQSNDIKKFYDPFEKGYSPAVDARPAGADRASPVPTMNNGVSYAPVGEGLAPPAPYAPQPASGQQPATGQPSGVFTPGKW